MGYFGYWLVVKGGTPRRLRSLGLEPAGEGAAAGWVFAGGSGGEIPGDFDERVARASQEGGAAVGAWVFDSDFAVVVAARDGAPAAQVVVRPELAAEYEVDAESDPDAFARWTDVAPRQLSADEVRAVLREDWVFAEEGVAELLERAGLPAPYDPFAVPKLGANVIVSVGGSRPPRPKRATRASVDGDELGGYVAPLGWMSDTAIVGDRSVAWRDLRFVPGVGDDFVGIWDREQPAEPVARFPRTERGASRLSDELARLQQPLVRHVFGLETLRGLVRPLEVGDTMRLAQRELSLRDARWIAGEGDGFVGVWDRERPDEPVERLARGFENEQRAERTAELLQLAHELANRRLPGVRLWLPRSLPEWVRHEIDLTNVRMSAAMRRQL